MEELLSIWLDSRKFYWRLLLKSVEEFQIWLQQTKVSGTLREEISTFMVISL
jgi:hypothetical protein